MLSRAVCVSRICRSCRHGLAPHRVAVLSRPLPPQTDLARRAYASDHHGVASKDLIEALISGKVPPVQPKSSGRRKKHRQRRATDDDDEWEILDDNATTPKNLPETSPSKPSDSKALDSSPLGEDTSESREMGSPGRTDEATKTLASAPELHASKQSLSREPVTSSSNREDNGSSQAYERSRRMRGPPPFDHEFLKQQHISVGALGQSIDALVIKDPNRMRKRGPGSLSLPADTNTLGDLDWKSLLDSRADYNEEHGASAEALRNIEDMRPIGSSTIPRSAMRRLIDDLSFGFTTEQLAFYYRQMNKADLPLSSWEPSYPWIREQAVWKPATPERHGAETTKQRLARMIAVRQWNLNIQEEVENPGLATVRVTRDVFLLVSHPSIGIIDSLKAELLDESIGETITSGPDSSLVFQTRKGAIPMILDRINEVLKFATTRSVPLEDINAESLHQDVLDELARVTKTVIRPSKEDNKLQISWIGQQDSLAEGSEEPEIMPVEDPANIVLRLLRGRPSQHLEFDEQIVARHIKRKATIRRAGTLVPHFRENRSMSWRDKLRQWSRFIIPTSIPGELKPRHLRLVDNVDIPAPEAGARGTNHLTATFGHILHTRPEPGQKRGSKYRRRILAPAMPHPASFTEFVPEEEADLATQTSIILNFIPSPGHGQSDGPELPEVKLTLPVTRGADFTNFSMATNSRLCAVVPWFRKDVLVPDDAVDVRIVQQREFSLDVAEQQSIQDFFNASEFNLNEGRLQTPSTTRFQLPRRMLSTEDASEGTEDCLYLFAGLEVHQTVDLAWKGHTLRYSSIEAGQHGGTRQELSLVGNIEAADADEVAAKKKNFLKVLEVAVAGKYWSWNNGANQVRELPNNDDLSWRHDEPDAEFDMDDVDALPDRDAFIEARAPIPELSLDLGGRSEVAEECDEALREGQHLADDIEGTLLQLRSISEPGPESGRGDIADHAADAQRIVQLLAQDTEDAAHAPGSAAPESEQRASSLSDDTPNSTRSPETVQSQEKTTSSNSTGDTGDGPRSS